MLTETQTREVARRVRSLFDRADNLPPGVHGVRAHDGWFPNNLDVIVTDVLNGQGMEADDVVFGGGADLNEGFETSPIQFRDGDDGLVAVCTPQGGTALRACTVRCSKETGAVTFNGVTRQLPDGYTYEGEPVRAQRAGTTIEVYIPAFADDDDNLDIDDGDDDGGW